MEGEGSSHRAVIAEGPVKLHKAIEFEHLPGEFRKLWVARHGEQPTWAVALIELRPDRLFSYDATKQEAN
jgi:hypothetical protein